MRIFSNEKLSKNLRSGALASAAVALMAGALIAAGSLTATSAGLPENSVKLLTAKFEPRQIVQIEVGDFHFKPGQIAPVHTHTAPAIGYVAKGTIIYQVEGEKPQILNAGDAFYEPTGSRILRFDNASATAEAIFLDFNLEQTGEPFIVFEETPTEAIDRRTLPTVAMEGQEIEQADIYSSELAPGGQLKLDNHAPTMGLVAEGVIELRIKGQAVQRIIAGGTFALPTNDSMALLINTSSEVSAKIITFRLQ